MLFCVVCDTFVENGNCHDFQFGSVSGSGQLFDRCEPTVSRQANRKNSGSNGNYFCPIGVFRGFEFELDLVPFFNQ